MTPEQLDEIKKLARDPNSAAFHDCMARQAIPLVKALREAWETLSNQKEEGWAWMYVANERAKERDEARALLAALKEEHRPADDLRSQLLAEIEAHAETKAKTKAEVERLRDIVAVNDQRLADVWDQSKAEIVRLRGLVDTLFQSRAEAESASDTAFKERDEARAEVERLKALLEKKP